MQVTFYNNIHVYMFYCRALMLRERESERNNNNDKMENATNSDAYMHMQHKHIE